MVSASETPENGAGLTAAVVASITFETNVYPPDIGNVEPTWRTSHRR